jgi:opacity protein-like surface antigen
MRKLFAGVAMATALAFAAQAAPSNMYVKIFGGVDFAPDLDFGSSSYEMETGFNYGAALGWNLTPNWAVEGAVTYNESEYTCCTPNESDLMNLSINGIYSFTSSSAFTPYVGLGLGYGRLHYEGDGPQLEDWTLTYQAIAGARYAVSTTVDLFGEYRYVGTSDASDSGLDWEYRAHVLSAGLRFNF